MTPPPLRVFVGYDGREHAAWEVCRGSILRHAGAPVLTVPLVTPDLARLGLYRRSADPRATTEFAYTRFLVPALAGDRGWALFCDCDFLFRADIAELFALADDRFAVMAVQHDHRPGETVKMDGQPQAAYPRKNWSSLMLFNLAHPDTRRLTAAVVNRETPAFLHRFGWTTDEAIGALPEAWNWLAGVSPTTGGPADGPPKAIHYTLGGPWFPGLEGVPLAGEWFAAAEDLGLDRHGWPWVTATN